MNTLAQSICTTNQIVYFYTQHDCVNSMVMVVVRKENLVSGIN